MESYLKKSKDKPFVKNLVAESGDSEGVKQALNQAHLYDKGLIGQSADTKYVQRKKEAAQKLMQEKERVINEQLQHKLKGLESEVADEVLKQALDLDVDHEVQRRYEAAKRNLEESAGMESARSIIS